MLQSLKSRLSGVKPRIADVRAKLMNTEYTKQISVLRSFIAVVAVVGMIFAALHVFIGFMGFDRTPDKTTGEVPSFFDVKEYQYYLLIACFFALSALALTVLHRLPAISVLTSTVTVTYLMILFDEKLLTAGPMTFLLFSIFVFVGSTVVTISFDRASGLETYHYVICFIGIVIALWTMILFFRTIGAPERLYDTLKPFEELEGEAATRRYARLEMLAEMGENETAIHYFRLALCQMIAALVVVGLPKLRFLGRIASVALLAYIVYLVGAEKLAYYPMFFVIPTIAFAVGVQAMAIHLPTERGASPTDAEQITSADRES